MQKRKQKRVPELLTGDESGHVNCFRPHPWHGLEVGPEPPEVLNAYIEITPFDLNEV